VFADIMAAATGCEQSNCTHLSLLVRRFVRACRHPIRGRVASASSGPQSPSARLPEATRRSV